MTFCGFADLIHIFLKYSNIFGYLNFKLSNIIWNNCFSWSLKRSTYTCFLDTCLQKYILQYKFHILQNTILQMYLIEKKFFSKMMIWYLVSNLVKGRRNIEQCPFTITVIIIPIFKFIQFLFLNRLLVQTFKRQCSFLYIPLLLITCS